jgi:ubiquinone/menaquinone biosynthesis C-methylase UbiE
MARWTKENLLHAAGVLKQGRNPAATVYDSIGPDFFLAPAPGWLNLGLWEGRGDAKEAPAAVRRLVETIAAELPKDGVVLDVGNGLGAQDPVIARVAQPRALIALNITASQLLAGRDRLAEAHARAINGDAVRIPLRDATVDGVISVEAAFHFSSRGAFFREARRVLRPAGVLTMSDVPAQRRPRTPAELLAGISQLRLWGMKPSAASSAEEIAAAVEAAGFTDVRTRLCGDRVIEPALRWARQALDAASGAPPSQIAGARFLLRQVELLWRNGLIEYLLLRAAAA